MPKLRALWCLLAFPWCLLALPASGFSQTHPPLFGDRPDFTESATITTAGRIQFEGGWTAQGDDRVSAHVLGGVVRAGVAERWEGWVEVTWFAMDDERGDEVSGRGDANVGAKVLVREGSPPRGLAAAVLVASSVPIGDDGIGERGWQPEARLLLGWELSPVWSLGVNGGGGFPLVGGERFGQAVASASLARALSPAVAALLEAYVVSPADPEGREAAYAHGGLGFSLGDDSTLDLRLGAGLTAASSDWLVGLELTRGWRRP